MSVKDLKPIKLGKYSGRNTFSDITNIGPTEFREITNFDIYGGMNGDYLRVRRGSTLIVPEEAPEKLPDNILNKVVFPTLGGEFFIYNVNLSSQGRFYGQREGENPFLIGGSFMVMAGDITGFLSDIVLDGLPAGQTVYIQAEKDLGLYAVRVFSDEGMTELIAFGSIVDSTPLPYTLTLDEQESSGISGSVSIDVDPDTGETGSAAYIEFDVDDNVNPVDMKVYNDRVYVFSPNGNKIIYYDADNDTLYGRPMGLEAHPFSGETSAPGDMPVGGIFTWGIEKIIQVNGADLVASTPNRYSITGLLATFDIADGGKELSLNSTLWGDDPYWTHLRLWRSKNQVVDLSDPLSPIDSQGSPDVLYEVALITRAEAFNATVEPIDTGGDLPPGNDGVEAGIDGEFIKIIDGNDDSVLINAIGLDLIGLIPLPGCRTGTVNKGRVWASGIGDDFIAPNGPLIDPVIREDWLYTTEQQSQYQEQWDAQAYLNAGRDGDRTESLLTLLEDVIGFRSSTTRRVASGNPASLCQMLDDKIGVPSFRCTGYIPGIGICAICSDGYFRYLGFDEQWHQYIGKTEISQSIYDLTFPIIADPKADFVYMNGKLLMLIPDGAIAALGVKEGKGWSLYDYPETFAVAFNFSDGERAAAAQDERYLLEIETTATTDADFNDVEADPIDITGSFEGFAFTAAGKLLEVLRYSFWGKLSNVPTITAKSSNQTWRIEPSFIDPGLFAANPSLNEREYVFFPQPLDTTPFKWVPLRGQYITFSLSLVGPAMISWQQVEARLRDTKGDLGVFPDGGFIPQGPGWVQASLFTLNFEDPATTFYDASGKGQNYEWAGIGTKTNRVTQKPGKGLTMAGGGYVSRGTETVTPYIGNKNLAFQTVFSLASSGSVVVYGRTGTIYYRLTVTTTNAVFEVLNGDESAVYTSTFAFVVGTVYALSFMLKSDYSGQFYYDSVAVSSFGGARTTVKTGSPAPLGYSVASPASAFVEIQSIDGWNGLGNMVARIEPDSSITTAFVFLILDSVIVAQSLTIDTTTQPVTDIPLLEVGGSGISGVATVFGGWSGEDESGAITITPASGGIIQTVGTISFLTVAKTYVGPDQAKRFWAVVKAY